MTDLIRFRDGEHWVGARPMAEGDIEHFVSYWHDGGADLAFLGIDLEKLGSRDDTRARLRVMCDPHRRADVTGYTFFEDERVIGFTNINIHGRSKGYLHVHLTDPQARRRGLLSAIFLRSLPVIAEQVLAELPIDGLVLETRTRNEGINRVVQKTGLRPLRTEYLENPDGLAGPGEFNVYELDREVITALQAAIMQASAMEFTR